jgi:hypothetical protein
MIDIDKSRHSVGYSREAAEKIARRAFHVENIIRSVRTPTNLESEYLTLNREYAQDMLAFADDLDEIIDKLELEYKYGK